MVSKISSLLDSLLFFLFLHRWELFATVDVNLQMFSCKGKVLAICLP